MARIVILGAGISGDTAARYLGKWIGKKHQVIVVSPNSKWNWIPSNIWVGIGEMTERQVTFELAPVYKKVNVEFRQAKALSVHPDGNSEHAKPFVTIEYTELARSGQTDTVEYDYLINATGPKLNFGATPGLTGDWLYGVSLYAGSCVRSECAITKTD